MSKFCGYNVHSAELLAIISDIANNSALCCCDLLREVGLPVTHTHTHRCKETMWGDGYIN